MVLDKLNAFCPEKKRKISSDDQPFYTEQLKRLDKKHREYIRNRRSRRSKRYKRLEELYDKKVSEEKINFKSKMIDDVMTARDGQWYSKLK